MPKPYRIGLDVGGVLINTLNDDPSTSFFGDNYIHTTPVQGALEAVSTLIQILGADNVFIISKASKKTQRKTLLWLAAHNFFSAGFSSCNLHFCDAWAEKASIARQLRLNCFVDDRIDVLNYMHGIVRHRVWFGSQPDNVRSIHRLLVARNWPGALAEILRVRR